MQAARGPGMGAGGQRVSPQGTESFLPAGAQHMPSLPFLQAVPVPSLIPPCARPRPPPQSPPPPPSLPLGGALFWWGSSALQAHQEGHRGVRGSAAGLHADHGKQEGRGVLRDLLPVPGQPRLSAGPGGWSLPARALCGGPGARGRVRCASRAARCRGCEVSRGGLQGPHPPTQQRQHKEKALMT